MLGQIIIIMQPAFSCNAILESPAEDDANSHWSQLTAFWGASKMPRPGIGPGTFRSSVWRSPNWAIAAIVFENAVLLEYCLHYAVDAAHSLQSFLAFRVYRLLYTFGLPASAAWSSGMILASGARGPGSIPGAALLNGVEEFWYTPEHLMQAIQVQIQEHEQCSGKKHYSTQWTIMPRQHQRS